MPIALICFFLPSILIFSSNYKAEGKYYTLYFNDFADKIDIESIYSKTTLKLNKCGVNSEKDKAKILIVNNSLLFSILMPFNHKGLATNNVLFNIIVVNRGNIKTNSTLGKFPLDALIVHEVVHGIIKNYVKLPINKIPLYINEGYPEHISFINEKDKKLLLKNYDNNLNHTYYKYLLEYRKNVNITSIDSLNKYLSDKFRK